MLKKRKKNGNKICHLYFAKEFSQSIKSVLTATVEPFLPTPPVKIIFKVLMHDHIPKGRARSVGTAPK